MSLLVLGLLVTFIYTANNFKLGTSQKIIAVLLFFLNIRILLIHFYLSKIILDYPHALLITHLISRIAIPLLFLVIFYDVIRPYWKWYDSFHFLPVLIFVFIFKDIYLGTFLYAINAAKAYDDYIIINNLEHTRNFDD